MSEDDLMPRQAEDFRAESDALAAILDPLTDAEFATPTLFKRWTIDDVIGHLHMFNVAADLTLESADGFAQFYAEIAEGRGTGRSMLDVQSDWLKGARGRKLFDLWRAQYERTAQNYASADPRTRLKWAGPDMSARSCITARQMETWAHGQEVFDVLGIDRIDTDRIRNIAHLGVSTFGWTFANRREPVPTPVPYVHLHAPSGAVWEWNEIQRDNRVEGTATEFCQVVTQVRNVGDTQLRSAGAIAQRWMAVAQCFAGPPEAPPTPGSRRKRDILREAKGD